MKFAVFICLFFSILPLFSYNDCLNDEKIQESCIRELFKNGEFALADAHIDNVEFASKTDKNILKTELFLKLADYDEVEKSVSRLPNDVKNTLYYKMILVKTLTARKRFNQALEIIDEIKASYPVYYLFSDVDVVFCRIFFAGNKSRCAYRSHFQGISYDNSVIFQVCSKDIRYHLL